LTSWNSVIDAEKHPDKSLTIAMVGKYKGMSDCYKSLNEAIKHAGIRTRKQINVQHIDAEDVEKNGTEILKQFSGIIVPGGFGERGIEGKIKTAQFARENRVPYLGICLGLQVAVIEYARNVVHLNKANSMEFDIKTPYPVICLVDKEGKITDIGGTMRLGNQVCHLTENSLVKTIYGKKDITERHRHRYEVNQALLPKLVECGMQVTGISPENHLVEMIELKDHPWFVACQFHPEFTSTPRHGHPLFEQFVLASLKNVRK
jgi:CTP synthase